MKHWNETAKKNPTKTGHYHCTDDLEGISTTIWKYQINEDGTGEWMGDKFWDKPLKYWSEPIPVNSSTLNETVIRETVDRVLTEAFLSSLLNDTPNKFNVYIDKLIHQDSDYVDYGVFDIADDRLLIVKDSYKLAKEYVNQTPEWTLVKYKSKTGH